MPDHGLSKPNILVVEDNYLIAEAVGDLLRECGCDVAGSVGQVERGMQFLAERTVDGAVVDINLNGARSFPICAELQRRNVPFFFLTGLSSSMVLPPAFRAAR